MTTQESWKGMDPSLFLSGDSSGDESYCAPETPVVIPVLIAIISVVGLIANTIVIFIVTVLKEYQKSVTNIYVLQLAIADFIFLFQLPFQVQTLLTGEWSYGVLWCKLSEAIKMLNYYSSILFLTVMSVDRYLAINFAMNQKAAKLRTKRAAFIVSTCLWMLSILSVINILIYANVHECACQLYFPGGIDFSDYDWGSGTMNITSDEPLLAFASGIGSTPDELTRIFLEDDTVCSFAKPQYSSYFKIWITCNFLLAFLLPLLVICVCYSLIIRRILRPMGIGTKSQKSNKTRRRVTIMVTALVSTFIACWLPYHAFNLARLNDVRMLAQACDNIFQFTTVLAYSNSAVNPFFYTFLGTNFRKRWGNAVGKARKGIRQSILSHSGDYTPGTSFKGRRRKSSAASTSTAAKNRDDVSVSSFATKHTIVQPSHAIKEDKI